LTSEKGEARGQFQNKTTFIPKSMGHVLILDFGTFKKMTGGPVHGGFTEKQVF
jgi:hypothetical protein